MNFIACTFTTSHREDEISADFRMCRFCEILEKEPGQEETSWYIICTSEGTGILGSEVRGFSCSL
jgi:hypothetical protein